jgi:hypothetical protein
MLAFELRLASVSLLALLVVAPACDESGLTSPVDVVDSGAAGAVDGHRADAVDGNRADLADGGGIDMADVHEGPDGRGAADGGVRADGGSPSWRPATCDEPELDQIPNTDQFKVAQLVVGKWFNCDALSMFQTSDDIGVEIVDDGNWYKLYWTGSEVVRGLGFGKRGTWSSYSGGICCSVTLEAQGAGGGIAFWPAFATSPRKMQVSTSAGGFMTTLATGEN